MVFMGADECEQFSDDNYHFGLFTTKTGVAIKRLRDSKLIRAFVVKTDKQWSEPLRLDAWGLEGLAGSSAL